MNEKKRPVLFHRSLLQTTPGISLLYKGSAEKALVLKEICHSPM